MVKHGVRIGNMGTQVMKCKHELSENELREIASRYGQSHVFQFWDELDNSRRQELLLQLQSIDFELMDRLIRQWIINEPSPEIFNEILPIPVIPLSEMETERGKEAWECGEEALRQGKVGLFLVAGGQGTRLGYEGPKGSYPIGPITKKSLFEYHAEKIRNLQRRYSCCLPWYIMVSESNEEATRSFFESHSYFGLNPKDVYFARQPMVPCVDEYGKFLLETPYRLAMNPNGHGGTIQTIVEKGILQDAINRGIELLSYFQVDNWAVKVADPRFIGYHVLNHAEMSSKIIRKDSLREPVGVHCLCDGQYRVIEYSELDIYPQLLETDEAGNMKFYAGNPAMHVITLSFVEKVYYRFKEFPWHKAHKKIPFINEKGELIKPEKPNGYKFETFIFDALRFTEHPPIAIEIQREGEYTPIKQYEGDNSVVKAREAMTRYWFSWLIEAGYTLSEDLLHQKDFYIEISPAFALTREEFIEKSKRYQWAIKNRGFAIDESGNLIIQQTV